MEALVAHAASALNDVQVASEVRASLEGVVRRVEDAEHAAEVKRLTRALRLARAHVEVAMAEREQDRLRRFHEAMEAAALRRKFESEMQRVAAELADKRRIETDLLDRDKQVEDLAHQVSVLAAKLQVEVARSGAGGSGARAGAGAVKGPTATEATTPGEPEAHLLFGRLNRELFHGILRFVQPADVLSLAHTNKAFFRRVDDMFSGPMPGTAVRGGEALGSRTWTNTPSRRSSADGADPGGAVSVPDVAEPPQTPLQASPPRSKLGRLLSRGGGSQSSATSQADAKALAKANARIKALEAELVKVATEREDLAAKLTANEKVRDFLMGKLKDAETDVREADERRDQALAQSTSDRQVISFLDNHTRELEEESTKLRKERDDALAELTAANAEHESKLRTVAEMLEMTKREKAEAEMVFKKEKKQLIKAIKTMRDKAGTT